MRESAIEKHLREQVELYGGVCRKWVTPGRKGPPDRICIFDYPDLFFVETKTLDGVIKSWQKREHERLRARGWRVYVVRSVEEVDVLMFHYKILKERAMAGKPKPKPKPKPC